MAEHLENLVAEHLEWSGGVVRRNVFVGRRSAGGWDMELDVLAYHPALARVVHVEPSLDGDSWAEREQRFRKKLEAGKRHAFTEVFPWLDRNSVTFEQWIIVPRRGKRTQLVGARLMTVDEYIASVRKDIVPVGTGAHGAIPSKYPLLRMIQFVINGYYGVVSDEVVSGWQ